MARLIRMSRVITSTLSRHSLLRSFAPTHDGSILASRRHLTSIIWKGRQSSVCGITPTMWRNTTSHSSIMPINQYTTQRGIPLKPIFKEFERCDSKKELKLQWDDGHTYEYPYVWLRDNCACPLCFDAGIKQRIFTMNNLDLDIVPSHVTLSENSETITICWPDGHESNFTAECLRSVEFSEEQPRRNTKFWGSDLIKSLPMFNFQDLLNDDRILLQFLENIRDVGLILMKGVPTKTGQVRKLAERVSHLKVTVYGPDFSVVSKFDPSSVAYTGLGLDFHTDLPQYMHTPGIQLLHCIKQCPGDGGKNIFSDGFNAALQLKEEDPESFNTLLSTTVYYFDIGTDFYEFHLKTPCTILTYDRMNDYIEVRYSNFTRDSHMPMSKDKVFKLYKAMKKFDDIIHRPDNLLTLRMEDGDMVVFDNNRTIHGRTEFKVTETGMRHIEGGYIDWDGVYSRIRVLRAKLGMPIFDN
ncbi:gamma-butyrobetaine dioxygenase-like [Glandiceps talaboti]